MTDPSSPNIPGYELLSELGSGGMATVYLANQTSLDRKVAIKVMRIGQQEGDDPQTAEKRFLREGLMLARLTHKNVCGIFDIAKVGSYAYIAMEYLDGGTLGDRLRRGMSASEAISVIVQLAGALAVAHDMGIVHRDLKPSNVMMRGRVPVLTDFGIARDISTDRTEITGDSILGTPNYMSPEQISGLKIDGRSDVYSLGVMLFELLAGRQPFRGDTPIVVCMQHLHAPIPELPEAFAELQPVVEAMLAKDRDERIPDMPSVVLALRSALLDSESLRKALRFDAGQPLTEQLRELGFSLDGPSGVKLRASLKTPRKQVLQESSGPKPASAESTPVAPTPPPPKSRRNLWIALTVGLLLLFSLGLWWKLSAEKLTPGELAVLKTMLNRFDAQVLSGELVVPRNDNALTSLEGMYVVSRTHPEVVARQQAFRNAAARQADKLAASDQFGEARKLLNDAAPMFDSAELEQRLAQLEKAQAAAGRDATIAQRMTELNGLLDTPGATSDPRLQSLLDELLQLTSASDPRFLALADRVAALLTAELQLAVAQADLASATSVRDRLRQLLPDAAATATAVKQVDALAGRMSAEQVRAETLALLQAPEFTPAVVDQVLAGLAILRNGGLDAAAETLGQTLVTRTLTAARTALAAGDLVATRALLVPVLERFSTDGALKTLETSLVAAETALVERQRLDEEALRAGRLALDAVPWGQVVSVTGSDGQARVLGADPTTPLTLSLPEGNYQVVIQGPDGRTRQQANAVVKRGEVSVTELRFAAIDTDAYLKQAGYQ